MARARRTVVPKFIQINTQADYNKYIKPALGKGADAYGLEDIKGMWWELDDGTRIGAAKTMREIRDGIDKRPRIIFISGAGDERGITDMSLTEYAETMGLSVKDYLNGFTLESRKAMTAWSYLEELAVLDEEERGVMNAEIAMMGESKKQTNEMIGNKKWVIRIKRLGKNYYVCSSSFRVNKAFRYPSLGGPFVCSDWDITERDMAKYDNYNDAKKAWDDMAQALRGGLPFYKEGEDYEIVQVNFSMMGESKKHEGYGGTKSVMSIWGNRPRDVYPEVSYSSVNDMYNTLLKYGYGDKHPIYYKNNSPEQIKGHILGYFKWTPTNSDADIEADALAAATMIKNNFNKSESKEPADEKLGYEKGHKNSRGENAPWVIRDHKNGKVLASFAKKGDAEAHLERMKHYKKNENSVMDWANKIKDAVANAAKAAGLENRITASATNMPKLFVDVYQIGTMGDGINWEITGNLGVRRFDHQNVKRHWSVGSIEELEKSLTNEFQQLKSGKFIEETKAISDRLRAYRRNKVVGAKGESYERATKEIQVRKNGQPWSRYAVTWPEYVGTYTKEAKERGWDEVRVIDLGGKGKHEALFNAKALEDLAMNGIKSAVMAAWSGAGVKNFKLDIQRNDYDLDVYSKTLDGTPTGTSWRILPIEGSVVRYTDNLTNGDTEVAADIPYITEDDVERIFTDEFKRLDDDMSEGYVSKEGNWGANNPDGFRKLDDLLEAAGFQCTFDNRFGDELVARDSEKFYVIEYNVPPDMVVDKNKPWEIFDGDSGEFMKNFADPKTAAAYLIAKKGKE